MLPWRARPPRLWWCLVPLSLVLVLVAEVGLGAGGALVGGSWLLCLCLTLPPRQRLSYVALFPFPHPRRLCVRLFPSVRRFRSRCSLMLALLLPPRPLCCLFRPPLLSWALFRWLCFVVLGMGCVPSLPMLSASRRSRWPCSLGGIWRVLVPSPLSLLLPRRSFLVRVVTLALFGALPL